ncbi:unnamed protein product [Blepharisma stoltei]|uniref:Uncharacterized protein n=1 Tax=Blepharisma stoltei TaxID=1481888 RepID=A0AAU9IX63_9CILI|nr:unnamed protein product [Blepharisma stoltei]
MENLDICLTPNSLRDMLKKRAKLPLYLQVLRIREIRQTYLKIELSDSSCIFNGVGTKTAAFKSSIHYGFTPMCLIQVNSYDIITSKDGSDKVITLENFFVVSPQTSIIGNPKWISRVNNFFDENPTSVSDNNSNKSVQIVSEMEKSASESNHSEGSTLFQGQKIAQLIEDTNKMLYEIKTVYDSRFNQLESQMQGLQAAMQKIIDNFKINS